MKFVDVCLTHQELENSYCKNKIVVIITIICQALTKYIIVNTVVDS